MSSGRDYISMMKNVVVNELELMNVRTKEKVFKIRLTAAPIMGFPS